VPFSNLGHLGGLGHLRRYRIRSGGVLWALAGAKLPLKFYDPRCRGSCGGGILKFTIFFNSTPPPQIWSKGGPSRTVSGCVATAQEHDPVRTFVQNLAVLEEGAGILKKLPPQKQNFPKKCFSLNLNFVQN
jgi:hypothetical protein